MENKLYCLQKFKEQTLEDASLMKSIAELFVKNVENDVEQIQVAFQNKEYEMVRRLAHKAKSGFLVMGSTELYQDALNIEMVAKKNDADNAFVKMIPAYIQQCLLLSEQLKTDFLSATS